MKKEMTLVSTTAAACRGKELIPAISEACPSPGVHAATLKIRLCFLLQARSCHTNLLCCGSVSRLAVWQVHAALHVFGRVSFLKCFQEFCCPLFITSFQNELSISDIEGYIRQPRHNNRISASLP